MGYGIKHMHLPPSPLLKNNGIIQEKGGKQWNASAVRLKTDRN